MTGERDLNRAVLDNLDDDAPPLAGAGLRAAAGTDPGRVRSIRESVDDAGPLAADEFTQEVGGLGSRDAACEAIRRLGRSAWRAGYAARLHWRQGFVHGVELPAAAFLAHAADLFAAHPIVRVRLTDKQASRSPDVTGAYVWGECPPVPVGLPAWRRSGNRVRAADRASDVAAELFAAGLPRAGFETANQADDALSAACVAYGCQLAGLAPLA